MRVDRASAGSSSREDIDPGAAASRLRFHGFFTGPITSLQRLTPRAPCDACRRGGHSRECGRPGGRPVCRRARDQARRRARARHRPARSSCRCASSSCSSRWRGEVGAIITREDLYATVWGGELRPGDRSVDVYVSKLRGKLEAALPDRRFIHTHPGFGYRFQTAAFTKCSHAEARPAAEDDCHAPGTPVQAARDAPAYLERVPVIMNNPARGDVVIKNKMGALARLRGARAGSRRMRQLQ